MKVRIKSVRESVLKEWFSEKDFKAMDPSEQEQYLKDHPNSKFQPDNGGSKTDKDDKDTSNKTNNDTRGKDTQKKEPSNTVSADEVKFYEDKISNINNLLSMTDSNPDKFSDAVDTSKYLELLNNLGSKKKYNRYKELLDRKGSLSTTDKKWLLMDIKEFMTDPRNKVINLKSKEDLTKLPQNFEELKSKISNPSEKTLERKETFEDSKKLASAWSAVRKLLKSDQDIKNKFDEITSEYNEEKSKYDELNRMYNYRNAHGYAKSSMDWILDDMKPHKEKFNKLNKERNELLKSKLKDLPDNFDYENRVTSGDVDYQKENYIRSLLSDAGLDISQLDDKGFDDEYIKFMRDYTEKMKKQL